jgi:hypothetical protein
MGMCEFVHGSSIGGAPVFRLSSTVWWAIPLLCQRTLPEMLSDSFINGENTYN